MKKIKTLQDIKDRVGESHGRLTLVDIHEEAEQIAQTKILCRCSCGNTRIVAWRRFVINAISNCRECAKHQNQARLKARRNFLKGKDFEDPLRGELLKVIMQDRIILPGEELEVYSDAYEYVLLASDPEAELAWWRADAAKHLSRNEQL